MSPRAAALLTLCAVLALALAGCGEDRQAGGGTLRTVPTPVGEAATTSGDAAGATPIDVSLVDFRLQPSSPRLARPGAISFVATNDGQTRHALRVDGPTGAVGSPALLPGQRASVALRLAPGTYKWYCPVADHEQRGMVGRVRVGA